MPQLIDHIDAIARKQRRDVLYLTFHEQARCASESEDDDIPWFSEYDWREDNLRTTVCEWLTEHNITWQKCGHVASENMMLSYQGQIYLDAPYDENDPTYQIVRDYLENADGSMKFPTVKFWYLPLGVAMQNAHHDEPGFWEQWAEKF